MNKIQSFGAVFALFVWCYGANAAIFQANPGNYRSLLSNLQAGDILELEAGTYPDGLPISGRNGTAGNRIIIRGPASGNPAVLTGRACCNTIQIEDSSYIDISNLKIDGQSIAGIDGVNSRGITHHITLSDLLIVGHGFDQSDVGISTKGTAWNWIIRRCRIIAAGTGMYLGNSPGNFPFVAGLIENNLILDTIGYNIQIKQQNPRPTNIGLPTGVNRTIIRNNVFSKKNNASSGAASRPNLLVGHLPLSGDGQDDVYDIYGNFFYENPSESLFQGEGNIGLYGNLFVTSSGNAISIRPHKDVPREVLVFQNTVVASGTGIRITGGNSAFSQRAVGNAVFAATPVNAADQADNITDGYSAANNYLTAPFAAIGQLDLYPLAGTLNGQSLVTTSFTGYTDWELDFDGQTRDQTIRGAYGTDGQNPGWQLALDIKPANGSGSAPIVTLSASPASVTTGGNVTLSWSSPAADSCVASGDWSGNKAISGSESTGPLTQVSAYTLTCSNSFGSDFKTVTIQVNPVDPAPTIDFQANPDTVAYDGFTTLSWTASNATSCTASGDWSGNKNVIDSESVGPLQTNSSFTQTCTGAGGQSSRTLMVTVQDPPGPAPAPPPAAGSGGGGSGLSLLLLLLGVTGWAQTRPA